MIKKITEDYCSYEVAKLLKEKGFEIDTNRDYWKIGEDGIMYFMSSIGAYSSNPNDVYAIYRPENSYPCPTIQMAMKWLRDMHNLFIFPFPQMNTNKFWTEIYQLSDNQEWKNLYCESIDLQDYSTYEEAVEAAIKYSLENII